MFLSICKKSKCVVLKSSDHPSEVLDLIDDFDEHYRVMECDDKQFDEKYMGRLLKVVDNEIIDLSEDEEFYQNCTDCPDMHK